jgi:hypothetical protein
MTSKVPEIILRLCEKIEVAAQLPTLRFVEPDAPYVISVSPVTYPVVTLIKLYDRTVGALGYREIYGREVAAVFCFHIIPFTIDANPNSLDKFVSHAINFLKAVDVALRLERLGIPYAEWLYRSFGFKPLPTTSSSDTVSYLQSFSNYDEVPVGGYFSVVGYAEPTVKIYRRVAKRHPYEKELVGTIKPDEPFPDWLKSLTLEIYLRE